jgi:hypothetical protein
LVKVTVSLASVVTREVLSVCGEPDWSRITCLLKLPKVDIPSS